MLFPSTNAETIWTRTLLSSEFILSIMLDHDGKVKGKISRFESFPLITLQINPKCAEYRMC